MIIVISKIMAKRIKIGEFEFRKKVFDCVKYWDVRVDIVFNIKDKTNKIMYVNLNISVIVSILIVWFGVSETKYENITSIPLT